MLFPKRLAAVVAAASSLGLSACSAGHTAVVQPAKTSSIVLAATAAATSLDFTTTGGAAIPAALMGNVYETLVNIDKEGNIIPGLAASWEIKDDTTYTFHLRDNVYFSNGDAFSAQSAAFSINYVKNNWTNGLSAQMKPVSDVKVIDPLTLEVTLSKPSQQWLWSMSTAVGAMMTESGIATLATAPIGTGPFVVRSFAPKDFVDLDINPHYWGTPASQAVTIKYFPDTISTVNALRSGSVDIVWAMQSPELIPTLPQDYKVTVGTTNGEVLLSMNNRTAPFDDVRVRQAVAYGIDRKAINDVLFDGLAKDTGGAPVSPTDPWASDKNYYSFDPGKARQLMESAGAVGTKLTITAPTLPYTQTLAELVYSQLRDIGFDVSIESAEFPAVWLGQVMGAKDYQMSMVAHVEPRDITTIFGNPNYYIGYDDAHTRDLFAQADAAPASESVTLMQDAVDQIMEDMPALTVANMPNIVLTAPGITGVEANQITDGIALRNIKEEK